mgnify:CR=1 FL=1
MARQAPYVAGYRDSGGVVMQAAPTGVKAGEWDDKLLSVLGVPRSVLPEVRSSSEVYAETTLFGARIKIAGIAGRAAEFSDFEI